MYLLTFLLFVCYSFSKELCPGKVSLTIYLSGSLFKHPFVVVDGPAVLGDIDFMVRTGLYQIPSKNVTVHSKFVYTPSQT